VENTRECLDGNYPRYKGGYRATLIFKGRQGVGNDRGLAWEPTVYKYGKKA